MTNRAHFLCCWALRLLLGYLLLAIGYTVASAATVNASYNFTNSVGQPARLTYVSITPLCPQATGGTYLSPTTVTFGASVYPSMTNGSFTITNILVSGYAYWIRWSEGGPVYSRTNLFPADISGDVIGPQYDGFYERGIAAPGRQFTYLNATVTNTTLVVGVAGTNMGLGTVAIFSGTNANGLKFNTISGSGIATVSSNDNNITISVTGEALTNSDSRLVRFLGTQVTVRSPGGVPILQFERPTGPSATTNGFSSVNDSNGDSITVYFGGTQAPSGDSPRFFTNWISAGSFVQNGVGVADTNLTTAARASYTNAGVIDPTNYATANVISGGNNREFPLPIGRFNLWYIAGATHNATLVSNVVNLANTLHYNDRRIKTVMVTDGHQSNRVNGAYTFLTNYSGAGNSAPWGSGVVTNNITNLLAHAAANNMDLGIYAEPSITTLASADLGFTGTGSFGHIEDDAKLFAALGFKYVQFDLIVSAGQKLLYAQEFARAIRLTPQAQQRPIFIYSSGFGFDPDNPLQELPNSLAAGTLNSIRVHGDPSSCPSGGCAWTNNLFFMDRDYQALQYTDKGTYLSPETSPISEDPLYVNPTKGYWLWCAFVPMNLDYNYPYGPTDGVRAMQITNDNVLVTVWSDRLGDRATSVFSNANYQVFRRSLEGGKLAVYLQNRQRDITNAASVRWDQLGLLTNSFYQVTDAWGGTNVGTLISNTFAWMIPTNSADLFILTPGLSGDANGLTNLSANNLTGIIPQRNLPTTITASNLVATNLFYGYGNPISRLELHGVFGGEVGWGTQLLENATSPNMKLYFSNPNFVLEDYYGGRNVIQYSGVSKALTLGTGNPGENIVANGSSAFSGSGSALTSLPADQISTGQLNPARLQGVLTNFNALPITNSSGQTVTINNGVATMINSNAVTTGSLSLTNGFASFATNRFNSYGTAGFTNALAGSNNGQGGTNVMNAAVFAVSGTLEYWRRTGANGSTVATIGMWTNTFSVVNSNLTFSVGINDGFVLRSATGVGIHLYAQ